MSGHAQKAALAKQDYALPEPILTPGVKAFLENFRCGQVGLRAGRAIRKALRKLRDPIQHKIWIRQYALPLRNAMLLARPLAVHVGYVPVLLTPRGSTAGDFWAGLSSAGHEDALILSLLGPGMIVFDIGASAGLLAIGAAKKVGGASVFAFEPCSSTCALLRRNLRLNRTDDVHLEQIALADAVGEATLQIHARGRDGLNTLAPATNAEGRVVGQEKVRVTTIDAFLQEGDIPRVDLMKVQVQGAELMLLRGAQNLLRRQDAPLILYDGFGFLTREFGYHPVESLWFLESCGYSLFVLNGGTGEISELRQDYRYDSTVIAAKPGHPAYRKLQASVR